MSECCRRIIIRLNEIRIERQSVPHMDRHCIHAWIIQSTTVRQSQYVQHVSHKRQTLKWFTKGPTKEPKVSKHSKYPSSNDEATSIMEMNAWTWNSKLKCEYKPLGQSLGSKVNQKVKTKLDIQQEASTIKQEHVLKRTKSKALSKVISWAWEGKGNFKAYNWSSRIKIPY